MATGVCNILAAVIIMLPVFLLLLRGFSFILLDKKASKLKISSNGVDCKHILYSQTRRIRSRRREMKEFISTDLRCDSSCPTYQETAHMVTNSLCSCYGTRSLQPALHLVWKCIVFVLFSFEQHARPTNSIHFFRIQLKAGVRNCFVLTCVVTETLFF